MTSFEALVAAELAGLLRAGVPSRAVRLTVRELVIEHIGRGPLGAREVSDTVEATLRAAGALVSEHVAPEDLVEVVCVASLEAVRGHGGESARWLTEATSTVSAVLDELIRAHGGEPSWSWLAQRLGRW